jgi:cytochrome c-type biogenesis protein CcmF
MLAVIGNLLIFCTLCSNASIIALSILAKKTKNMQIYSVGFQLASMLTLAYGFITSNFELQNVFINSSSISPLIYKIAATWSSHEGSLLFFISVLSVIGMYANLKVQELKAKPYATIVQRAIIGTLLLSLWVSANPFKVNTFATSEGIGLNPLLQDVALLYHPPILYLGYAFYLVPFSYCLVIFKDQQNSVNYFYNLLVFSRLALLFLTLGIGLGSWWAYRELGWGGFWFFDPVENISLLPWLSGIAFHHSLLSSIKHNLLKKWTVFLGLLVFLFPLFGMFLVRSNLLISVHSFALDSTKALALGIISFIALMAALRSYFNYSAEVEKKPSIISKQYGFVIANVLWLMAIISIVFAIMVPIIFHIFTGLEMSLEVDYFKITLLPILILINIVTGIYAYMSQNKGLKYYSSSGLLTMLLSFALIYHFQIKILMANCAILLSIFLIIVTILDFLIKSNYFRVALRFGQIAMLLGHLSYGLLTLSIALNTALEDEVDLVGTKNAKVKMGNFEITMLGITDGYGPNYLRQIVNLKVENINTGMTIKLAPENRWYVIENKMTSDSSIYSFVDYDLYAVLNRIDGGQAHIKIYYRPYISFVWLATIMLVLSLATSLFAVKYNKKIS